MIEIRRAAYAEIPQIMEFIEEHWKSGHILARDRAFFEWQFVQDKEVNVYIAVDKDSGRVLGIQGFIPCNRTEFGVDISGSIWKVLKTENIMLGIDLDAVLAGSLPVRYVCSPGIKKRIVRQLEKNGCKAAMLEQYYRLGKCDEYKIAKIEHRIIPEVNKPVSELVKITDMDMFKRVIPEERLKERVLSKNYSYIEWRYFKHPIYHYDCWILSEDVEAVLVTRTQEYNGARACKIVDYYGDFRYMSNLLAGSDYIMKKESCEYIDCYSYGVASEIYEAAGFIKNQKASSNIIPNYFSPFVLENIEIWMIDPQVPGVVAFRGDGDQDRPC